MREVGVKLVALTCDSSTVYCALVCVCVYSVCACGVCVCGVCVCCACVCGLCVVRCVCVVRVCVCVVCVCGHLQLARHPHLSVSVGRRVFQRLQILLYWLCGGSFPRHCVAGRLTVSCRQHRDCPHFTALTFILLATRIVPM